MSKKELKTNAMRILERMNIQFTYDTYDCSGFTDGVQTADTLGLPREQVFKTLVAVGKSHNYYVFVIPVADELDMKKAAAAMNEKSMELLHLSELTKVTGYVRGGCTAIGMKKQFPTAIQEDALKQEHIFVSGGKLGMQLCLAPEDLGKAANAFFADVVRGGK